MAMWPSNSSSQALTRRERCVATPSQMISNGCLIWRLSAARNSMICSERMAPGKKRK